MKIIITGILVLFNFVIIAQLDNLMIGDSPMSSSAQLEAQSTTQGVLIPRLTTAERIAINLPAAGLLVFDKDYLSFWYYSGVTWFELGHNSASYFQDVDGDTKIWMEKTPDEDMIRFEAAGLEVAQLDNNRFKLHKDTDLLIGSSFSGVGNKTFYTSSGYGFRSGYVNGNQWDPIQIGNNSTAFGENNIAIATLSTAWGQNNTVNNTYATSWGLSNTASGTHAVSFGENNRATGNYSTAWGNNTEASGLYATAWGGSTLASGRASTAFGFVTKALGENSTVWGSGSEAQGLGSTAFGNFCIAKGDYSTAIGNNTNAESYLETVVGRFNKITVAASTNSWDTNDLLFIIGNGTSTSNRKNAFEIYKNGKARSSGNIVLAANRNIDTPHNLIFKEASGPKYGLFIFNDEYLSIRRILNDGSTVSTLNSNKFGQVVIGNGYITKHFNVWGQASKSSSGAWLANSDRRLKKNIQTIDSSFAMQQVLKMKGVSYEWDETITNAERPNGTQYGFIAQDLEAIWPAHISKDPKGYLMTAYGEYDPMFVEAFKAQQAQIQNLINEQKTLTGKALQLENEQQAMKEKIVRLTKEASELILQNHNPEFMSATKSESISHKTLKR